MSEQSAFESERYEIYEEAGARHYWAEARHRVIWRHLRSHRRSPDAPVLDVGCGTGLMVEFLRERGVDAAGCDIGTPAPASADVARWLHLGTDVLSLPSEVLRRPATALLLDVLEHLGDPATFLRGLVAAMPALQEIVITVPARGELWTNFDEYYGHHRRYSRSEVTELAAAAGLTVAYQTYFFHSLYLPLLAIARSKRRRSLLRRGDAPAIPRWLNRLLRWWLVADERLIPGAIFGSSILAVLRPR